MTITAEQTTAKRNSNLIFGLMVLIAYLSMFAEPVWPFTTVGFVSLVGLGIAYACIGTFGWDVAERTNSTRGWILYFGLMVLIGATIQYISRASSFISLILLPLAGHSAVHLSWRGTLFVSGLIVLAFISTLATLIDLGTAMRVGLTSFLAGVVFAVVFTRIAVRAERDRREMERLAGELRDANQKLREYSAQVDELATTRERNRLAREIHDSLGHYLTVINMQLAAARAIFDTDRDRALDAVCKAQTMTQDGLAEVRRSVSTLRAQPAGDRPLPEVIAPLVEECRSAGILADLTVVGTPRLLAPQAEHTLYRAAQEALTNIRKHAHASRANVRLEYDDRGPVRLQVQDNGVGSSDASGGFGLIGLRERVQLLGGEVRTQTASGQGFRLDVEVPA